jgi:hypothetical protein
LDGRRVASEFETLDMCNTTHCLFSLLGLEWTPRATRIAAVPFKGEPAERRVFSFEQTASLRQFTSAKLTPIFCGPSRPNVIATRSFPPRHKCDEDDLHFQPYLPLWGRRVKPEHVPRETLLSGRKPDTLPKHKLPASPRICAARLVK